MGGFSGLIYEFTNYEQVMHVPWAALIKLHRNSICSTFSLSFFLFLIFRRCSLSISLFSFFQQQGNYAKYLKGLHSEQLAKLQLKNQHECELLEDIRQFTIKRSAIEKSYSEALLKISSAYLNKKMVCIPEIKLDGTEKWWVFFIYVRVCISWIHLSIVFRGDKSFSSIIAHTQTHTHTHTHT